MKKLVFAAALWALFAMGLSAQQLRTNYRSGSIVHISTEYAPLSLGAERAQLRLEEVTFPDEEKLYLLYLNLEGEKPLLAPKGVKISFNLSSGGIVRAQQIGEDSATKPRLENGRYCNRLKYALPPADLQKILGGVKSVEIITGWNPDDYLQAAFPKNELSEQLTAALNAIRSGKDKTVALSAELSGYSDNKESILATTLPVVARGEQRVYNVILSLLYYKTSNEEDIDLAFQIGTEDSCHILLDTEIMFECADGTLLSLPQTRDEVNFVYLYPTVDQVRLLSGGIRSVRIPYEGGLLEDTFQDGDGLAEAINAQYQRLVSVSPR